MTAEIAIINRSAVTLAADSAMTLSVRGRDKIYTSADKLFELCNKDSIGIMVYNNLEFLGYPIELVVKQFRDAKTNGRFKTVKDASQAFFDFLMNDLKHSADSLESHVHNTIAAIFSKIKEEFDFEAVRIWTELQQQPKKRKKYDFQTLFESKIKKHEEFFKSSTIDGPIALIPDQDLKDTYKDVFAKAIADCFPKMPLDDDDRAILIDLAVAILKSSHLSQSYSGLVFAGYGADELFPSLYAFEIDGLIANVIKRKSTKDLESHKGAEIIPFAQREMVDRFMFGVDPQFQNAIALFFRKLLESTGESIINVSTSSPKKKGDLKKKLDEAVAASLNTLKKDFLPQSKKKYREQIEDMVLFMAKPELASLAEALVNITSVKRKFSAERETVAGPIDVAVISKTDGFVWVKRKHYFTPELNPRYFWRKYGLTI